MWKRKHYRNSLLIAVISACMPAAIIGALVYIIGTMNIEKEAKATHQKQIAYATERIDSNLTHLETVVAQWSFNLNLSRPYEGIDIQQDFANIQTIYRALTWINSSDPLILEATLYLDQQRALVRENKGITLLPPGAGQEQYHALMQIPRDIYWTETIGPSRESAPYMLVARLPGGTAALVVEISAKSLNHLIAELEPEGRGATLLLQQDRKYISLGLDPLDAPSPLSRHLAEAAEGAAPQASFIRDWNGASYSFSFATMKRIGQLWTVGTAAPLAQLTKPVQTLSQLIIYSSIAGLLLALLLSWFASRQLYRPIRHLAAQLLPGRADSDATDELDELASAWSHMSRESAALRERLNRQLPSLRESFLLQLVQGHLYFLTDEELNERLRQFGWDTDETIYAAMLVQVHGLHGREGKFLPGDEQLVTFAAANMAEELLQSRELAGSVINFQDMTVGLLLVFRAETSEQERRSELAHTAQELTFTLRRLLHVEVSVCVGKSAAAASGIPRLFEDTRKGLNRKKVSEPQQIIDVNDLMPDGLENVAYPFEAEKTLLQSLRMGAEPEVYEELERFVILLRAQAVEENHVRQGLLQLFAHMQDAMLQSGYNPLKWFNGSDPWEMLIAVKGQSAMLVWLKEQLIAPYIRELHSTQNLQLKRLVENVLVTIHETYMKDISLEACADLHGTYPKKLSLAFKQITGSTFIDYLTQYRLNQAKQLLRDTDDTIAEIAERVGYQPPYFNRLFKKNEGVTPGQFREKS